VLCSVLFPLPLAVQFVAQFLRLAQRPHGAAVPASRFCQLRLADSHGLLADVSADGEYLLPVAVRRVCLCVVADDPVELAMLRDQPVLGGPLGRECCPRCRLERGDAGHGAFVLNPGEFGVLDQAGFVVKLRRYPVLLPVLAVALALLGPASGGAALGAGGGTALFAVLTVVCLAAGAAALRLNRHLPPVANQMGAAPADADEVPQEAVTVG
jgi:hypothetical protein